MSAMEPLCRLIRVNICMLTKEENILLEAGLFTRICEELKEIFRKQYEAYFHLMKFTIEEGNKMLEAKFAQLILRDILSTDEYNLQGIACYTNTPEDVVEEVMIGRNTDPSAAFLRKLINLHQSVRCDLYDTIMKKITP